MNLIARYQKIAKDTRNTWQKHHFWLSFLHSPVLFPTAAKIQHCSMRQSRVRTENVPHARSSCDPMLDLRSESWANWSCLKVHTSDHEWPLVTTNDHEWPRVTTSDYKWPRVRLHQNIWLKSWWRHHYIILSNNHYFTANCRPFLETFIPGFDIFAISDWMGEGLGDGQGGCMVGGTNIPPPAPYNLGSHHFS